MKFLRAIGVVAFCLAALWLIQSARGAPATQPAGSVSGKVSSEGAVPLSEMVVYLESPEEGRHFEVPQTVPRISQKGAQFSPALLIICVGQTVEFPNDEDRPIEHNVFSNAPAKRFDLGLYRPGESRKVTFDKPGPIFIYCSIHRHMDGVIYVAPTPYTSRVAQDGKYSIADVPPGIWLVKTWQRRRRFHELSVPVLVQAEKPATVDLELRRK